MNDISTIMAISPLDGRYFNQIQELNEFFSEYALMKYRLRVEIHWIQFLAEEAKLPNFPIITAQTSDLNEVVELFALDDAMRIKEIELETNHDVKAVEYFLKEEINRNYSAFVALNEFIHFGCTSEDINNLAYGMMINGARSNCLLPTLQLLLTRLIDMAHEYAGLAMLARTHGQPATPTTLGKEFANVAARLDQQLTQLKDVSIMGKFNGATGNYNAFAMAYPTIKWLELSKAFVTRLGLQWNTYTTQIEPHDKISEFCAILLRVNTILIDFNRDIWAYLSINYFNQHSPSHEVGSSTMPHKVNPIDFENSEGNLGIANALLAHMMNKLPISRWQRDLSDSTVLRNFGVVMGHCLLGYKGTLKGLKQLSPNINKIEEDLNNHWEVLAEAIQTTMRREQCEGAYEALKTMAKGKNANQVTLMEWIKSLNISEALKQELLQLKPQTYIGYAEILAKKI